MAGSLREIKAKLLQLSKRVMAQEPCKMVSASKLTPF